MADLKIPNLNKNSDKFFLKKKLSLSRKSKGKLIKESFLMLILGVLIIYINFLIPNKISVFNNFLKNFSKLIANISGSMFYVYEICIAVFIVVSLSIALVMIMGSFTRLLKVAKRKSRRLKF